MESVVCSICKGKEINTVNLLCEITTITTVRKLVFALLPVIATLFLVTSFDDADAIAYFPPPLKQMAEGTLPENVTCTEGLEIIQRSSNGLPACVKTSSVEKLIQRGWAIEKTLDVSTSVSYKFEVVADNLTIPWSIDWLPDGTAIFTERNGNLRMIQDEQLVQEPLLSLSVGGVEGGMLGVAVDPDYEQNNFIYLYYTYNEFLTTTNKVVRYHLDDKTVTEDKVLIDGIPGGPFHDGGRIQFGPDGKLYIATGDAGDPNLSQDLGSVAGKILRINSDGTIPEDNPWQDSSVYSIGHRNPQGIDWDESGNLVATEHGPSGWRGSAHDEINVIIPGKNYGWPDVIGDETKEGLTNPILHTGDDTWAPSGAEFYDGDKIPQWTGKYFVATLRGSHLHIIDFDLENNKVISHEKLFQDQFGRLRDVQTGPDGYLYILTSNQDGRGFPNPNDDKIIRIVPTS